MKNTTKQATRQPTGKATKTIKNRITAFLLALLLVTTVLSPQNPVKAQDTATEYADTTESDSDRPSGGHDVTTRGKLVATQTKILESDFFSEESRYLNSADEYILIELIQPAPESSNLAQRMSYILFKNPTSEGFSTSIKTTMQNGSVNSSSDELKFSSLSAFKHNNGTDVYYVYPFAGYAHGYNEVKDGTMYSTATIVSDYHYYISTDYIFGTIGLNDHVWNAYIKGNLLETLPTKDEIAGMTPVRDDSIGYLPRARYFDDRKKHSGSGVVNRIDTTSTIQWDSFQEPYATDLDNPYYIEIYAKLHYTTGHKKENNSSIWETDTPSMKMYQYKKFGEIKYISERFEFPFLEPLDNYLQTLDVTHDASGNTINSKSDVNIFPTTCYVSDYYVRLLHYDYEKQQLLCGGWTKLTLNENGGCTSETGDFPDGSPSDDDDFIPDDDPKEWDDTGWEPNLDPDDPDDPDYPDFGIDTSSIGAFIVSAITSFLNAFKSILSFVGEFPELCKHVFLFLPDEIGTLMFCGMAAIIVMRFLGR